MPQPETEFVLDRLASVVDWVANNYTLANGDAAQLKRIDRENSRVYEGSATVDMSTPIRQRSAELQDAALVGAGHADRTPTPMGSGYDHQVETVIAVRVEGLHHDEYGHVDPEGANGVPWRLLVDRIRDAVLDAGVRTYPSVGRSDHQYYDITITNEDPGSTAFGDYYRHDIDFELFGEEELP